MRPSPKGFACRNPCLGVHCVTNHGVTKRWDASEDV